LKERNCHNCGHLRRVRGSYTCQFKRCVMGAKPYYSRGIPGGHEWFVAPGVRLRACQWVPRDGLDRFMGGA